MRYRILVASLFLMAVLASTLALVGWKGISAQGPAPAARKHFLEVGKTYTFYSTESKGHFKILDISHNDWVKAEYQRYGEDKRVEGWINLNLTLRIDIEQ